MNKTTQVIETHFENPFGHLIRKSTYTPTVIKVTGGIFFSDEKSCKNEIVLEELFSMYVSGQTYGDIIIDEKKIGFDILFEFYDANGKQLNPKNIDKALLYKAFREGILHTGITELTTYDVISEYHFEVTKHEKIILISKLRKDML